MPSDRRHTPLPPNRGPAAGPGGPAHPGGVQKRPPRNAIATNPPVTTDRQKGRSDDVEERPYVARAGTAERRGETRRSARAAPRAPELRPRPSRAGPSTSPMPSSKPSCACPMRSSWSTRTGTSSGGTPRPSACSSGRSATPSAGRAWTWCTRTTRSSCCARCPPSTAGTSAHRSRSGSTRHRGGAWSKSSAPRWSGTARAPFCSACAISPSAGATRWAGATRAKCARSCTMPATSSCRSRRTAPSSRSRAPSRASSDTTPSWSSASP